MTLKGQSGIVGRASHPPRVAPFPAHAAVRSPEGIDWPLKSIIGANSRGLPPTRAVIILNEIYYL